MLPVDGRCESLCGRSCERLQPRTPPATPASFGVGLVKALVFRASEPLTLALLAVRALQRDDSDDDYRAAAEMKDDEDGDERDYEQRTLPW